MCRFDGGPILTTSRRPPRRPTSWPGLRNPLGRICPPVAGGPLFHFRRGGWWVEQKCRLDDVEESRCGGPAGVGHGYPMSRVPGHSIHFLDGGRPTPRHATKDSLSPADTARRASAMPPPVRRMMAAAAAGLRRAPLSLATRGCPHLDDRVLISSGDITHFHKSAMLSIGPIRSSGPCRGLCVCVCVCMPKW